MPTRRTPCCSEVGERKMPGDGDGDAARAAGGDEEGGEEGRLVLACLSLSSGGQVSGKLRAETGLAGNVESDAMSACQKN
jgi:hypothetical protein